jgi:dipeptidyl aminopeptidase/acylaminoacyl peptidase
VIRIHFLLNGKREKTMSSRKTAATLWIAFVFTLVLALTAFRGQAQEKPAAEPAKKEIPAPKSKDGKRLFSALDTQRVRGVGAVKLSPDGRRVAYTVGEPQLDDGKEWKTITHVWVVPAAGGAPRQVTRGEKSATQPAWSPDGKYLAFLSDREKEHEDQVWMMYSDGGEAWQATSHKGGVRSFEFSPDSKRIVFLAADQPDKEEEERKKIKDDPMVIDHDIKMNHLWLFDLDKKEEKRLTEGNFTCSDAQWSPDGTRISFTETPTPKADDSSLTAVWVVNVATGEKKKLAEGGGNSHTARWSPDGNWIAFTGSAQTSGPYQTNLFVVSASGGSPRKLASSFALDAGTPVWSPDAKTIYFSTDAREAIEIFAADVGAAGVRQITQKGGIIFLAAIAKDGNTAVGTIADSKHPSEIMRADLGSAAVERITEHNAWLKDYALGEADVAKWKSKDGMEIEGILTKPVDYDASKKYPLILNPHGGPTGASLLGFDVTAQALAANGYLVLQPNFRGSTGRGEKFAQANKDTWGKGDYEDCISGVQAMVDRGIADSTRLGAEGWSYGGYMTMWILTQTDMFKAVSPGAGLPDLYSMYSQTDVHRFLTWFYGDKAPWDNFGEYWEHSPMKYINNVKTPTMILHGQADTRVPIAQSEEFYEALKERGVAVEFVVYPRENHGFTEPRHRMDRVQRYLYFFGKYLNNPPVTEPKK